VITVYFICAISLHINHKTIKAMYWNIYIYIIYSFNGAFWWCYQTPCCWHLQVLILSCNHNIWLTIKVYDWLFALFV